MKSHRDVEFASKASFIAFFLLFPGFFFYNTMVAKGIISPFLGGYFGFISISMLPVLIIVFLKLKLFDNLISMLFLILCFYTVLIALSAFAFKDHGDFSVNLLYWSLSGVLFNFICYSIGQGIPLQKYKAILFFSLVSFAVIAVTNIGDDGNFYLKAGAESESEFISTYQGFARSIVMLGLVLSSAFLGVNRIFVIVNAVTVATLFLNGARSEFAFYVLSVVTLLLVIKKRNVWVSVGWLITMGGMILYMFFSSYTAGSRMLQLTDISQASSYQARSSLLDGALVSISHAPFLGAYGDYVNSGGLGTYAHNILSAWVDLGLVGFLLYILIFVLLWVFALSSIKKKWLNLVEFRVFFLFLIFTTLSMLISKSYEYMFFGFVIGLYCQARRASKNWRS